MRRPQRLAAFLVFVLFIAGAVAAGFYLPSETQHVAPPPTSHWEVTYCLDTDHGQVCRTDAHLAPLYFVDACVGLCSVPETVAEDLAVQVSALGGDG